MLLCSMMTVGAQSRANGKGFEPLGGAALGYRARFPRLTLALFSMVLCSMPLKAAAAETQTLMLETPSGHIVLSVLNTPASQGWACRSSIRADEGALIAFPTRTNLRALDVTVSTDHDLVFLDDNGVVTGVVKHVPQTNDLGGPAPKRTSAQQLLERQYDDVSYAIILSDGRSTTAGIARSNKLSSLNQ